MEVNTDLAQSEIVLTDICSKSNKKIQYVKFNGLFLSRATVTLHLFLEV